MPAVEMRTRDVQSGSTQLSAVSVGCIQLPEKLMKLPEAVDESQRALGS